MKNKQNNEPEPTEEDWLEHKVLTPKGI